MIPNNFCKHHWSRASILITSLLVTAQHSQPYRKIGRMQVLYNFSLVGIVILDLQICLSRFCIAAKNKNQCNQRDASTYISKTVYSVILQPKLFSTLPVNNITLSILTEYLGQLSTQNPGKPRTKVTQQIRICQCTYLSTV